MNCPHCQKELPDDTALWCPFWLVIALPAIADLIVLMFPFPGLDALNFMIPISFGGSAVCGLIGGITIARWCNREKMTLVLEALGFGLAMACVSFGLCFLGCTAAGLIQSAVS